MRQIRRELQGHQGVVEVEVLADVLTQRCIGWQLEQATVVVGNFEFFGRAQHALTFDATQLAHFDYERFAVFARRQLCAHRGAWNFDAHACIRCTTHDVKQSALPHVHLANAQAVSVGVLHSFFDFTHHDASERRCNGLEFFHFQTCHGQGIGQLLGGECGVAEFAQPGFGELHDESRVCVKLLELAQEANVAIEEQAQVVHAVTQHGETVHAHTKGKANETLRVEAHVAHHVGVHLA